MILPLFMEFRFWWKLHGVPTLLNYVISNFTLSSTILKLIDSPTPDVTSLMQTISFLGSSPPTKLLLVKSYSPGSMLGMLRQLHYRELMESYVIAPNAIPNEQKLVVEVRFNPAVDY